VRLWAKPGSHARMLIRDLLVKAPRGRAAADQGARCQRWWCLPARRLGSTCSSGAAELHVPARRPRAVAESREAGEHISRARRPRAVAESREASEHVSQPGVRARAGSTNASRGLVEAVGAPPWSVRAPPPLHLHERL